MKKLVVILFILAAVGLLAYAQRANIAARLMAKGLETRLGADIVADLEDGLHLALCGAGGPLPAPNASGPCVAVVAGKRLFVVDAGTDGVRNLGRMGYQAGTIMMHAAAQKNGNRILTKITHDILDYHASPVEAAETARDAGVGHLLYYHIVPPLIIPGQKALYLDGAGDIFPDYTIG